MTKEVPFSTSLEWPNGRTFVEGPSYSLIRIYRSVTDVLQAWALRTAICRVVYSLQGPGPPPLEKQGGPESPSSPGSDVYEFLTPHRLVRSQYRGIVWAKEEGSRQESSDMREPKSVGGALLPPPGKGVVASAPFPSCSYAYMGTCHPVTNSQAGLADSTRTLPSTLQIWPMRD